MLIYAALFVLAGVSVLVHKCVVQKRMRCWDRGRISLLNRAEMLWCEWSIVQTRTGAIFHSDCRGRRGALLGVFVSGGCVCCLEESKVFAL